MQKRSMQKRVFPGKWSVTGGAVDPGEQPLDAMYRECKEELGVDLNPEQVELMMSIKRRHVFVDVYLDRENFNLNDLKLQEEEVSGVKWTTRQEIVQMMDDGYASTSIIKYFDLLCNLIDEENNT